MKKNIFSQLIPTEAKIQELEEKRLTQTIYKKREALKPDELMTKLVNTTHNKKWPNGRIYAKSEKDGYSSHSVSPYADTFLDNIEENIKPLILALKKKGYLSISSCEGHGIYFRRYITLVFPSRETALEFQAHIPFRLKYILKHCTESLNTKLDVDEYGNILGNKVVDSFVDREGSIRYINFLIKRSYVDAWLLELIISDRLKDEDGYWKYIKNWRQVLFKKFFMNWYTRKLTKFIQSDKFPANIY